MSGTATLLPKRRPELVVDQDIAADPSTGDLYNLGPEESFLLLGLDGQRTADELAVEFEDRFGAPLPREHLDEFLDLARDYGLLQRLESDPTPDVVTDSDPVVEATTAAAASPPGEPTRPAVPPPATPLPARRADLVIRSTHDDGQHVVKDPLTGDFYNLGPEESFLLLALDGQRTAADLAAAFETRFGSPLTADDVQDFLGIARSYHFLPDEEQAAPVPRSSRPVGWTSILYWRKSAFDPDRLFDWLEPRLRFLWTRTFLVFSAAVIIAALLVAWSNRLELVGRLPKALHWQMLGLAWLAMVTATTLHEFAHGLTCKHYGGEVHEVGFLLVFFTPCFYCNVSDAWLFKERSRRLWVTLAGGYWDLVMWAAAIFLWRLSAFDSIVNHVAWMVIAICGGRIFFNFNPLIKLDGYYLLSDGAGVPNLQQRGRDRVMGHLRWLLWGAPRPEREDKGRFVLLYGSLSLVYTVTLVAVMLVALSVYSYARWGLIALAGPAFLGWFVGRGLFQGLFAGEVTRMFKSRPIRLFTWLAFLGGAAAAGWFVEVEREAAGPFAVRPVTRAEIFAPVAGFLREVPLDEGDRVSPGGLVARLDVPDLASKLAQKRAEIAELTAKSVQVRLELEGARDDFGREDRLFKSGSGSQAAHQESQKKCRTLEAELEQCSARRTRVDQEVTYLEEMRGKLVVCSPVPGLIMTPRLKEMKGKFFHEGDLICAVEEPSVFRAEVKLPEQEVGRVRPGLRVTLKARALPFETFEGVVERVAPGATAPAATEVQSSVVVYCRVEAENSDLRPAMTGHARIQCGRCSLGRLVGEKVLRFIRTEFWW